MDVLDVEIPFRFTFRHALSERSVGHSVLVRARDDVGGVGYGECVPRSYVTGETPESVRDALSGRLLKQFEGASFGSFEELVEGLRAQLEGLPRGSHAAFCALELALLDLGGKVFGESAGSVLGPIRNREVRYSGVVSADGVERVAKTLKGLAGFGFSAVKVKVGESLEIDRQVLAAARETLGESCSLRVDANCAWNAEQALSHLEALAEFRLDGVEQPLPKDDLEGLVWLTERSPVKVIVDESLASLDDARTLADRKACHAFNIRISKCGGLINSARIRDLGAEAGIGCQLGAQVGETALLSAAGRQFATRSENVLFLEGSYGNLLLEEDVGRSDITIGRGGIAPCLEAPGLGVEVDPDRLERWILSREH
ncbi:MAG: dipeptide epimerase [Planctomycetota bacterium]